VDGALAKNGEEGDKGRPACGRGPTNRESLTYHPKEKLRKERRTWLDTFERIFGSQNYSGGGKKKGTPNDIREKKGRVSKESIGLSPTNIRGGCGANRLDKGMHRGKGALIKEGGFGCENGQERLASIGGKTPGIEASLVCKELSEKKP